MRVWMLSQNELGVGTLTYIDDSTAAAFGEKAEEKVLLAVAGSEEFDTFSGQLTATEKTFLWANTEDQKSALQDCS
eukprot:9567797-Alexandrium_andersonii.AAC.1